MTRFECLTIVILVSLAAAGVTVWAQFDYIATQYGQGYLSEEDFGRHQSKVQGTAAAPYRYRLLSDYALEGVLRLVPRDWAGGPDKAYKFVAFGFRLAQNFAVFMLAFWYFRTLGLSIGKGLLGMCLLTYGLCFAFHQSDLSFYTYTSLAFFLLAGAIIGRRRDWLILPLTLVAALNREDGVFIPVMLLCARLGEGNWRSWGGFRVLLSPWMRWAAL